jgi:hypothetical protein
MRRPCYEVRGHRDGQSQECDGQHGARGHPRILQHEGRPEEQQTRPEGTGLRGGVHTSIQIGHAEYAEGRDANEEGT